MAKSSNSFRDMLRKTSPVIYFLLLILVMFFLHVTLPIKQIDLDLLVYIGVGFVVAGIMMNTWTDQLFRLGGTTVKPYEKPTTLLTDGPFRISRHPMYLSITLMLIGAVLILGSVINLIPVILFVILMEIVFIPHEEKQLEKEFGKKWKEYKKKVRKWI